MSSFENEVLWDLCLITGWSVICESKEDLYLNYQCHYLKVYSGRGHLLEFEEDDLHPFGVSILPTYFKQSKKAWLLTQKTLAGNEA